MKRRFTIEFTAAELAQITLALAFYGVALATTPDRALLAELVADLDENPQSRREQALAARAVLEKIARTMGLDPASPAWRPPIK